MSTISNDVLEAISNMSLQELRELAKIVQAQIDNRKERERLVNLLKSAK